LFKKISEAGRRTAEQKADWKKNFGKLLEVYNVTPALAAGASVARSDPER
jgi:hypothetical protein